MTLALARSDRSARTALAGGFICAAAAATMWATKTIALKGPSGVGEVCAVFVAPVLAWLAWVRPLLVPYGIYVVLAPLDVLTQMSHQETIARIVGLVSGIALLAYAVRTRSLRVPPRTIVILGLLCGWMALSTFWSPANDPWREAMTMIDLAVLYLVLACFPTQRRDLVPLLGSILLGGIVAAAIGAYEFHAAGAAEMETLQDFHRISISVGQESLDPNMYADSLLLPFAIALTWFARTRRLLGGLAALCTIGLLVVAVALAGSRDATIGLCIVTLALAVTLRAYARVLLPAIALIGGAIALYPNAITRALQDAGGGYGRMSIWRIGEAAFLAHPLTGSGSGSFGTMYDRLYVKIFERYDVGWHMASHDLFIHYGVELGLIGLTLVVAWSLSQWFLARALPKSGTIGDVRAIAMASLLALGFAALFIDLFDVKFVWIAFALIAQARTVAIYCGSNA